MKRGLVASIILAILITALPFIVKIAEKKQIEAITPQENSTMIVGGVYYVGTATSHEGADILCVVPAKAYVDEPGKVVTLNVTVRFKHAQPCPYSDWKILVENSKNVEVIEETETKLEDPYTAFKQYKIKVLGNGSIDVVFKYGTGCPYGTEERVTVGFYIGTPTQTELVEANQTQSIVLENVTKTFKGKIEEVNVELRYFVVNGTKIYVRGRWGSYNWKDVLGMLKVGEYVEVVATYEEGTWKAEEIKIDGTTLRRG
ncbi:hypothetical protein A3L04_07990 [Thermococcus chitonophagus]|uniref:DUF5666 domain-containing protein n=1 Tax=Thermococcus chitonophagus TaxID=54262 RepID=A0A160VRI8_9EURY|nr:DUF5666 domain-containing protein [Thermococcus chitonophagus]ASJ17014.1 hypothetical protein A3L04_07990 [Thermococcus chitonophagus]CUX77603.1 hypothetical protein CHITON_0824 [Thermococcus chitonophagus]